MMTLCLTVFVASVLGSLHCAGMCGAFLAIAVGGRGTSLVRAQVAYHSGRLVTYLMLGTAAGAAGKLIDLGGSMVGLRPVAIIFAGATTITFGVVMLLNRRGWRVSLFRPPAVMQKLVTRVHRGVAGQSAGVRAMVIGLATTMLPCGWLYVFAAVAAGTASPLSGAVVMLAFWFGTLPVMAAVGFGVRGVMGGSSRVLPTASCVFMIVAGVGTIWSRGRLDPVGLIQSIDRTGNAAPAALVSSAPPCCEVPHDRK